MEEMNGKMDHVLWKLGCAVTSTLYYLLMSITMDIKCHATWVVETTY